MEGWIDKKSIGKNYDEDVLQVIACLLVELRDAVLQLKDEVGHIPYSA